MLRRNVLIFHQAALGDFIVTWPLAMGLSRIFAQQRIIYVTHSQKGALAERVLRIDSFDGEAGWHSLLSDSPNLPPASAKLLDGAAMVISFSGSDDDPFAKGVARVAPHAKIISLNTKRESPGHVTENLAAQLKDWAAISEAMRQMIRSIESRGVGIARKTENTVVVHPGAGKEPNRWPAERFIELIQQIRAKTRNNVRVLLGEAEMERWPKELISQFEAVAEVKRPNSLLELLDELLKASYFIGNDSGPTHLAGIIGVPTLALFGPTDPTRWRPLGPAVKVLRAEPLTEISVPVVYNQLSALMGG
jgi:ADP-heptose:LPS heptosyltransferase